MDLAEVFAGSTLGGLCPAALAMVFEAIGRGPALKSTPEYTRKTPGVAGEFSGRRAGRDPLHDPCRRPESVPPAPESARTGGCRQGALVASAGCLGRGGFLLVVLVGISRGARLLEESTSGPHPPGSLVGISGVGVLRFSSDTQPGGVEGVERRSWSGNFSWLFCPI